MSIARETTSGEGGPRRRVVRSIGAILFAFIAIGVLTLCVDQIFHALGVYPPWGEPMLEPGLNLLALSYRLIITVTGGYLVASLAPHSPVRHALILGGIGLVLGSLGGLAARDMSPTWFLVAVAITPPLCTWLGARVYLQGRDGE